MNLDSAANRLRMRSINMPSNLASGSQESNQVKTVGATLGNMHRDQDGQEEDRARQKQDRGRVAGAQDYELRYEAKKTGKSKAKVKAKVKRAVKKAGQKKVERSLGR